MKNYLKFIFYKNYIMIARNQYSQTQDGPFRHDSFLNSPLYRVQQQSVSNIFAWAGWAINKEKCFVLLILYVLFKCTTFHVIWRHVMSQEIGVNKLLILSHVSNFQVICLQNTRRTRYFLFEDTFLDTCSKLLICSKVFLAVFFFFYWYE